MTLTQTAPGKTSGVVLVTKSFGELRKDTQEKNDTQYFIKSPTGEGVSSNQIYGMLPDGRVYQFERDHGQWVAAKNFDVFQDSSRCLLVDREAYVPHLPKVGG